MEIRETPRIVKPDCVKAEARREASKMIKTTEDIRVQWKIVWKLFMLCGICLAAYFTIKYFSFDFLVKNWKGIFSTIFMFLILVVILTDLTSLNTIGGISSWGFKYRTKWIGKKMHLIGLT